MIRKLYLVHISGTCLHYIDFEEIKTEKSEKKAVHPQLASGFFSAIISFCDSAVDSGSNETEKICKLAWKNLDLYFFNLENFYLIIEADNKNLYLDDEDWKNIFNFLSSGIQSMIDSGTIQEGTGLIPDFTDFENNSREYIAKVLRRSLLKRLSKQ
jgi:hypothetical protein